MSRINRFSVAKCKSKFMNQSHFIYFLRLTPENGHYIFDLHDQSEDLNFLVNFIDPCCGDKWVASIEYDENNDNLVISYESCNQSVIPYESIVDSK